jgi:hypothetical protein
VPSPTPTPAPSIDPAAALAAALTGLSGAYAFESTVTVGTEVATRLSGAWSAGTSEVEVETGAATVTYRLVPPASWVREGEEGDWVELEGEVPAVDPLAALREPATVVLAAGDGAGVALTATYPPAALGLTGDVPVEVAIALRADGAVVARYTTSVNGVAATSETTMRPAPGATPIPAPSVGE